MLKSTRSYERDLYAPGRILFSAVLKSTRSYERDRIWVADRTAIRKA